MNRMKCTSAKQIYIDTKGKSQKMLCNIKFYYLSSEKSALAFGHILQSFVNFVRGPMISIQFAFTLYYWNKLFQ